MNAQNTPKPASMSLRPWRVVAALDGVTFEVWTRDDGTPGSRNNFAIATGIQDEAEAQLLASAPELETVAKKFIHGCEIGAQVGEVYFSALIDEARAATA